MDKQQQFLWIVQTTILANAINLSSSADKAGKYQHEISATGVGITMDDALRASAMIPLDMSARRAAAEFCSYMLSNLRDGEAAAGRDTLVPGWFAHH